MALIGEAACRGRLGEGLATFDQLPRKFETALDQIGMRSEANRAKEAAQQLEAIQSSEGRELAQRGRRGGIVVDPRLGYRDCRGEVRPVAALAARCGNQRQQQFLPAHGLRAAGLRRIKRSEQGSDASIPKDRTVEFEITPDKQVGGGRTDEAGLEIEDSPRAPAIA